MKSVLASILVVPFIYCTSIFAMNIDIDGNLNDWGVTPGSDYISSPEVSSWVEDSVDYAHNGYVGPGYGGQPYDFEAFYAFTDDLYLYVAMVTGMPPTGASPIFSQGGNPYTQTYFYPGDLALDLNGDSFFEYGLELTGYSDNTLDGPAGNGQYSYAPQKKGNLYRVSDTNGWNKGLALSNYVNTELNYRSSSSLSYIGSTGVVYNKYGTTDHYVMETSIPLYYFNIDPGVDWTLQWTMTCGNDIGYLTVDNPMDITTIPEPATLILLGLGMTGFLLRKRI